MVSCFSRLFTANEFQRCPFSVSLVEAILISSEPNRNVVYLLTVNLSRTLTCLPVHGKHLSSRGNNHIYSWSCYFCSGKLPNAATPSRHSFALVSSALFHVMGFIILFYLIYANLSSSHYTGINNWTLLCPCIKVYTKRLLGGMSRRCNW